MKRTVRALSKKDYFMNRLQDAIANHDQGKQIYYLNRYKQEVLKETQELNRQIAELKRKTAPKKRGELREKEFVFSFEGGGWNSVYAKTKRGAEKKAAEEWKNSGMKIVPGSCHIASEKEYKMLLSMFD